MNSIRTVLLLFCTISFFFVQEARFAQEARADRKKNGSENEEREIVVTATRTERDILDVPITTQLINEKTIMNSSSLTLAEVMENQSGVVLERSFAGKTLSLQGMDSKYTLVLIDGQRINGKTSGTINLDRFSLENIERVEVVKGAASSLYGSDAMGGVVNIITKKTKKPIEMGFVGSYGNLNAADGTGFIGLSGQKWSSQVFGGYHRRDSFDLNTNDLDTDGSQFQRYNLGNTSRFNFSKKFVITNRIEYKRYRTQGVDQTPTGSIFDITQLDEELQDTLSYTHDFRKSKLDIKASYFYFRSQFLQDQRGDTNDAYQETIDQIIDVNGKYTFTLLDSHIITSGGNGIVEQIRTPRLQGNQKRRYRGAGYLQDEWLFSEKYNAALIPGIRYDHDSQFGDAVSPKLASRFDITKKFILRASYGGGFRAPDFRQLYLIFENPSVGYRVKGNESLKPEHSQSFNGGLEYRAFKWLSFETNYFRNELENLINPQIKIQGSAGNLTLYSYTNIDRARTQGVESSMNVKFKKFKVKAGYMFIDAINRANNALLFGRPKHRGTLGLTYIEKTLGLVATTTARFVGSRPFNINEDDIQQKDIVFVDPYIFWDAKISFNLSSLARSRFDSIFFVRAENIFNEGHPAYLAIAPFSIFSGIEVRLQSTSSLKPKTNTSEVPK